jgi:hypothetical protein
MLTLRKSMVLGTAFFAGVAIAANAGPLCRTPRGPCQPPNPQIAALPSAVAVALAPDGAALPEVNVFGPQPPGGYYKAANANANDR